jgi:hypothetical protein
LQEFNLEDFVCRNSTVFFSSACGLEVQGYEIVSLVAMSAMTQRGAAWESHQNSGSNPDYLENDGG